MTREEAIKVIRKMLAYTDLSERANLTADMVDACHLAMKVLEQESVLNKIRSEIKALPTEHTAYGYNSAGELWTLKLISSDSVLEILDKYKAESED